MRAAVFVDAGYLYTAGSIVLTGSSQNREVMELRPLETVAQLKTSVEGQKEGIPLLRIYWYDGLLRGRRSPEQERMAIEDDVKLRLGTVTGGRQKGVDSLIVTDLIELARNHAISDAVLLLRRRRLENRSADSTKFRGSCTSYRNRTKSREPVQSSAGRS